MKKLFKISAVLFLLGCIGFGASGFLPGGPKVGLKYNSSGCVLLDPSGSLIDAESEFINGPQSNLGNVTIRCTSGGMTNNTGQAIVMKGSPGNTCFAFGMQTDNWHQVITPNGNGTLICIFP